MEILRKISLTFLLVLFGHLTFAQIQAELLAAFSKSYQLEAEKKYFEAIKTLEVAYTENSYETNLRLGWLNYLAGQYDKSIGYYNKSAALMTTAVEPLLGVLNPQIAKNDWANAEKTYLAILAIDSKNSSANYKLGLIYYYRKNYTAAKKYFDVVLNLYPFDYEAMLMSGWTLYFLGNQKDAKVLFQKVLLNRPNNSSALEGLGLIK